MFRITFDEHPAGVTMRIAGRFAGSFADEVRQTIARRNLPAGFVVDLSDVTFADSAGEEALKWLGAIGAKFMSENSYALHLCDRLQLPQVNGRVRGNGRHS